MTHCARTCLILAAIVATGTLWHKPPECGADNRVTSLQRLAEGQIERIKAARERISERLDLPQGQTVEQLQRGEEDLMRRIESLERIFEQIQEQLREGDVASRSMSRSASQELCVSLSEIDLQLAATRALAKKLKQSRQEIESKAGGKNSWNSPCGNGGGLGEDDISGCAADQQPAVDPVTLKPKFSG
jgi:TolA-binding protein